MSPSSTAEVNLEDVIKEVIVSGEIVHKATLIQIRKCNEGSEDVNNSCGDFHSILDTIQCNGNLVRCYQITLKTYKDYYF